MKNALLGIIAILSFSNSFSQITFQKTFGGVGNEYLDNCSGVKQTIDGGYIIAGYTFSFGAGSADVYLIKTNSYGDTLWTKTYGGVGYDWPSSVLQTIDSGYIIVGGSGGDILFIKTDIDGNTLWTKTISASNLMTGKEVHQTTDGGYIITGIINGFGAGGFDVYLIKTNDQGVSLWTRTYGGIRDDGGYSVQQTTDGGYIIAGQTDSLGMDGLDVYLIKTDSIGDTLWTKTYGGISEDNGFSIIQTSDGGYIISGSADSIGAGGYDVYLVKTDSLGDILWTRTYGGVGGEQGNQVQQTTDGGYILTGITESFGAGNQDVYLVKTDSLGDTLWTKTYGGTGNDYGYSIQQVIDGGFIIAGYTYSFGVGSSDIFLIKTDSNGNSGCNEGSAATIIGYPNTNSGNPATLVHSGGSIYNSNFSVGSGGIFSSICNSSDIIDLVAQNSFEVFPNPLSVSTTISFSLSQSENLVVSVYDIAGRLIANLFTGNMNSGGHEIKWNVSAENRIDGGVYFLSFVGEGFSISSKIVVVK